MPRKPSTPPRAPGRLSALRTPCARLLVLPACGEQAGQAGTGGPTAVGQAGRVERTGVAGSRHASIRSYPAHAEAPQACRRAAGRRPDASLRSATPRAEDASPASRRLCRSEPGKRRVRFGPVADPSRSFPETIPDSRAFRPAAPHRTSVSPAVCSLPNRNRRDATAPRARRAGCPACAAAREPNGARLAPFPGAPRKQADSPTSLPARRGPRDRGPPLGGPACSGGRSTFADLPADRAEVDRLNPARLVRS